MVEKEKKIALFKKNKILQETRARQERSLDRREEDNKQPIYCYSKKDASLLWRVESLKIFKELTLKYLFLKKQVKTSLYRTHRLAHLPLNQEEYSD